MDAKVEREATAPLGLDWRALKQTRLLAGERGLTIMPMCTEMARAWAGHHKRPTDLPSNGEESSKDAERNSQAGMKAFYDNPGDGELQGDPASSIRDWPACWRCGDGGAGYQLYSTEAQPCSGGPAFRSDSRASTAGCGDHGCLGSPQ